MVRSTFFKVSVAAIALSSAGLSLADSKNRTPIHHGKEHRASQRGVDHHVEIGLEELKKLVDAKSVYLVDVNSEKTYSKGHIPTAVNFAANEKNFLTLLPKDKNALIVAYCGGPMCSAWEEAAKTAHEAGYSNIKHFKGGLKVWKSAGLPLEKPTITK